jgi:hypothetical protein
MNPDEIDSLLENSEAEVDIYYIQLGLTAGVTYQQRMLTPPRHLTHTPLVFAEVRAGPIFTVDCSIYLI